VRVIRLPRHGASLPGRHRRVLLGRPPGAGQDHRRRRLLEQLETNPAQYLPEVAPIKTLGGDVVKIDLNRPMAEIRAELSKYPVKTRCRSPARSSSPATSRTRSSRSGSIRRGAARVLQGPPGLLRRPGQDPEGIRVGSFGPTTAGRMDSYVDLFQAAAARWSCSPRATAAQAGHRRLQEARRLLPRLDRRPGRDPGQDCIKKVEVLEYPELGMEAIWKIEVEDFPAFIVVDDKGNDFFVASATSSEAVSSIGSAVGVSSIGSEVGLFSIGSEVGLLSIGSAVGGATTVVGVGGVGAFTDGGSGCAVPFMIAIARSRSVGAWGFASPRELATAR
jgi:fumarate hydratase class I